MDCAMQRIRPMGLKRRQYLEANIGLPIVTNDAVDQAVNRVYKSARSRARRLIPADIKSKIDFSSFPYFSRKQKEYL
eukprot:UN08925